MDGISKLLVNTEKGVGSKIQQRWELRNNSLYAVYYKYFIVRVTRFSCIWHVDCKDVGKLIVRADGE